jgi:dTDP-glucose pyrophosphorylase
MKNKVLNRIIDIKNTILQALKKMDAEEVKLLFVYDMEVFKGILTIGDIQRAILAQTDLSSEVLCILDNKKIYAKPEDSIETIKSLMLSFRAECMPVVDASGVLKEVIFWEDIIEESFVLCQTPFDLPIVIMAGGKGTRLKPLTNVLPKPLIPIGEKTIIEDIMDKFVACGSHRFFISLNYKADFIQSYLEQQNNADYRLEFFTEDKPLGTAGSLALLKDKIQETFFVSNCDILIKEDYSQILHYHKENQNELTLITALKSFVIPYGIVETKKDGVLAAIKEKPDVSFHINTGMYILEPHILQQIPVNQYYDITDLIQNIIKRAGRVGCFPISEKAWTDIGDWREYNKLIH